MKLIPISKGKAFAVVDDEDYELLSKDTWFIIPCKHTTYARRSKRGSRETLMHRVLMKPVKGMLVDHQDGDGLNSQKLNLRVSSRTENNRNKRNLRRHTSIYKGVTWDKDCRKWRTKINNLHVGLFQNERYAALAYDMWAKELFKEYANLNF